MACTRFPSRRRTGSEAASATRTRSPRRPTSRPSSTSARGRTSTPSFPRGTRRSASSRRTSRGLLRGHHGAGPGVAGSAAGDGQARPRGARGRDRVPVPADVPSADGGRRRGAGGADGVPAAPEAPLLVGFPGRAARDAPRPARGHDRERRADLRDADPPGVDSGTAGPAHQRERHHGSPGPSHRGDRSPQRADGVPVGLPP